MSQDFAVEEEARETAPDGPKPDDRASIKRRLRLPLLIAAPVIVLIGALAFYLHGGRYESTDNAYVQSGLVSITPNVGGNVIAIEVHENQVVRAGQVLFRIDPGRYETAMRSADAQLADAQSHVAASQADYAAALARVQSANAQLDYARREAARQKDLLSQGISSQDQYDQAVLAVETARQAISAAAGEAESIKAALAGRVDAPISTQPGVRRANAAVDDARLNLGYTVVRAPQDGIVTKVNQLQVGDYVTAGKPVFTLVGKHMWVEANFKENQLDAMRPGQKATLISDLYGSKTVYHGTVVGVAAGSGSAFALLPAQNASGNWIKVIQRVPVRIRLDPKELQAHPLRVGLSMTVEVDLSSTPEQADGNGQDNGARATGPALSTPVYDHDATEIDARIRQIIQDNIGAAGEPGHEGGNSSGAAARNAKETQ